MKFDAGHRVDDGASEAIFSEINITPFTDVILVLLIIFMVSSSAMVDAARQQDQLEITLPKAGRASTQTRQDQAWVVALTQDGKLFADDGVVTEEQLETLLGKLFQRAPQTQIIVDADGHLTHARVVSILNKIRGAGFATVGLGTDDP